MSSTPAGPPTACHHARAVGETQAVQRDGPSPPQTHHEGEGAQETRCVVNTNSGLIYVLLILFILCFYILNVNAFFTTTWNNF